MIAVLCVALMTILTACTDSPAPASGRAERAAAPAATAPPPEKAPAAALDKRPSVRLSSVEGRAGEVVAIEASLVDGQGVVVASATDLRYAAAEVLVAVGANGQPDCELAATLGPSGAVRKQIFAREKVADGKAVLRVGILGVDNANPLPDGPLFTCRFRVAEEATAGAKEIVANTEASDARARAVPMQISTAVIAVN